MDIGTESTLRADVARKDEQIKVLRREIRNMQEAAEYRNLQLRALTIVQHVVCSGGCDVGVAHPELVNEAVVAEAERGVARLREWRENRKAR